MLRYACLSIIEGADDLLKSRMALSSKCDLLLAAAQVCSEASVPIFQKANFSLQSNCTSNAKSPAGNPAPPSGGLRLAPPPPPPPAFLTVSETSLVDQRLPTPSLSSPKLGLTPSQWVWIKSREWLHKDDAEGNPPPPPHTV